MKHILWKTRNGWIHSVNDTSPLTSDFGFLYVYKTLTEFVQRMEADDKRAKSTHVKQTQKKDCKK